MNLTYYTTKDYANKSIVLTMQKQSQNKPNQTQFYPPPAGWRVYPQRGRAATVARTNLRLISLYRKFTESILFWSRFVRRGIGRLRNLRRFGFSGYPVSGIKPGAEVDKFAPLRAKREEFARFGRFLKNCFNGFFASWTFVSHSSIISFGG